MRLQPTLHNRTHAQSALALVVVVVACGLYAYASGGVQWAFRAPEPARDPAITETASRVSPVRDAQVVPASFLLAEDQKPEIQLAYAKDTSGRDLGKDDFGQPVSDAARINAANFSRKFKLKTLNFPDNPPGRLTIYVGYSEIPVDFDGTSPVNGYIHPLELKEIENQGEREIYAIWIPKDKSTRYVSNKLKVKIDTRGPVLDTVDLTGDPATGVALVLHFEDDDLDHVTATESENYTIEPGKADGTFGTPLVLDDGKIVHEGKVVRIYVGRLYTGTYRLTLNGTKDKPRSASDGASKTGNTVAPIQDKVGNKAEGGDQVRFFDSLPGPVRGERIEFPEFLPTAKQPDPERRINPADRVVTAVARLYYFRDAHRVAQILNRTAESLNRAAVEQAERRAQEARRLADEATDDRKHLESEAVRAAEALRRAEHQLASAQDATAEAVRLKTEIKRVDQELEKLPPEPTTAQGTSPGGGGSAAPDPVNSAWRGRLLPLPPIGRVSHLLVQDTGSTGAADDANSKDVEAERKRLTDEKNQLQAQLDLLKESAGVDKVAQLQATVASLREQAANANEKSTQAQSKEDRAREEQFRLEVAAANEDPDTYAAAKTDSVDPVAQVSISVIGEGLLQLRGPQKGIDRIRTMIEQIDAPLGQVKVEIITVQLNGEKGERMEGPLGRVEANIGLGRFLTEQSLMLLRGAIQEEATRVALEHDQGGHYQVDRDRKYLYAFFGRDFIDELYEMDSEFLNTENKILGLHSMDTISLEQALFVLALARNDVRQRILANFMEKVHGDLVQAEFDYRRSSELFPHKTRAWLPHTDREKPEEFSYEGVALNNQQRYHFRNLLTFFGSIDECSIADPEGNTMNPVQREFIRLAQIFKARMITEMEMKQRVIERAMIETQRENDLQQEEEARNSVRPEVVRSSEELQKKRFDAAGELARQTVKALNVVEEVLLLSVDAAKARASEADRKIQAADALYSEAAAMARTFTELMKNGRKKEADAMIKRETPRIREMRAEIARMLKEASEETSSSLQQLSRAVPATPEATGEYQQLLLESRRLLEKAQEPSELKPLTEYGIDDAKRDLLGVAAAADQLEAAIRSRKTANERTKKLLEGSKDLWSEIRGLFDELASAASIDNFKWLNVLSTYRRLAQALLAVNREEDRSKLQQAADSIYKTAGERHLAEEEYNVAKHFLARTRQSLERRKLLDFLIEEYEQKHIDLLEGTRAQIASVDNYLKRLSIALEDDFKLQFYDPAFVRIRRAAREWDVTLGQVERTSILTNNRALAKVTPEATMEFDLPKRNIAIVEALDGAKALAQDYGALLQDPTFLAAYQLMGGGVNNGKVQNVVPGLPSSTDEYQMGFSQSQVTPSGAALQSLVPDPSIYKFETGTGYEIRPVIQPDGHSIVYDFLYMYTTNVREPVQADEKHLGRVRRHFINTQVQTSSFEIRELSRYQVALKAARTAQGVPLLQDIPVAGVLFRPLPSAESSIQQNVILAYSAVYPTLFDLMGLRWAPSVVDLNHISVRDSEHIVRGRNMAVTDSIFNISTRTVDDILGIEVDTPEYDRPDLYHQQRQPSPYHPGGYTAPKPRPDQDPTGEGFEVPDRRPIEYRQPPYDRRFRNPVRYEEVQLGPFDGEPAGGAAGTGVAAGEEKSAPPAKKAAKVGSNDAEATRPPSLSGELEIPGGVPEEKPAFGPQIAPLPQ